MGAVFAEASAVPQTIPPSIFFTMIKTVKCFLGVRKLNAKTMCVCVVSLGIFLYYSPSKFCLGTQKNYRPITVSSRVESIAVVDTVNIAICVNEALPVCYPQVLKRPMRRLNTIQLHRSILLYFRSVHSIIFLTYTNLSIYFVLYFS